MQQQEGARTVHEYRRNDIETSVVTNGDQSPLLGHLLSFLLPGKEKERVVRASQVLYDSVHRLTSSIGIASEILHQHLNMSPPSIKVIDTLTIKEALDLLVSAVQEIHCTASNMDKHIQKNLNPSLYDKLTVSRSSMQEKYTILRDFHESTMGIFGSVCGPLIAILLQDRSLPRSMEDTLHDMGTSPVLALHLEDLLVNSDTIVRSIQVGGESQPPQAWYDSFTKLFLGGDKASFETVADHLETVASALRPVCRNTHYLINEAEVYITFITDTKI